MSVGVVFPADDPPALEPDEHVGEGGSEDEELDAVEEDEALSVGGLDAKDGEVV